MSTTQSSGEPKPRSFTLTSPEALAARELRFWHWAAFSGFLVWYAVSVAVVLFEVELPAPWRWMDGLFYALGALTLVIGAARRLPWQSALVAAALIAGIGGGVAALGAHSGVPFGPILYGESLGGLLFGTLPWPVPLLWIMVILSSRGVARLIMRPWRKMSTYGFWVIGLTCALVVVLELSLEPFAVQVKQHWLWQTRPGPMTWQSAPWANFVGWAVTSLGILAFTTPWLILKQPTRQPTDYQSPAIWVLLNLYYIAGNVWNGLWLAATVGAVLAGLAVVFAVRGARW